MKTKYSILLFVCVVAVGGFLLWLLSPKSSSIELIHATKVEDEIAAGSSIYDQLSKKVFGHNLLIVGIAPQPEKYQDYVSGFISQLASQRKTVVVLKEENWPNLKLPTQVQVVNFDFDSVSKLDPNSEELTDTVEEIKSAIAGGATVVVYSASLYTTHLVEVNAIHRFERLYGEQIPSVTFGPLVLRSSEENLNEPACVGSMRDNDGSYALGCGQVYNSRNQYEKFISLKQETMILTEESPGDYLAQVYFAKKD